MDAPALAVIVLFAILVIAVFGGAVRSRLGFTFTALAATITATPAAARFGVGIDGFGPGFCLAIAGGFCRCGVALLGTVGGVIVPQLAGAFAVLLMVQHMRAFPRELIEAAQLDGRSSWATLWTVVVPNMRPALAALGIMGFISAWNEYLWPTLIMRQGAELVQVGVRAFLSAEGNNWGATMAAAGLATVPVLLIYVFLQRYVVDAFVRSGLK